MKTVVAVLTLPLPDQVSKIVLLMFGIPLSLSCKNLLVSSLPVDLKSSQNIFTIVVLGILFSICFAIFGYYVLSRGA